VTRPSRRALLLAGLGAAAAACSRSRPAAAPARPAPHAATPPATASGPVPASPRSAPGGPAVEIGTGPRDRPQVALTFHGAGAPALAEELLRAAEDGHAAVTVLAVGTWLDANPRMAARVLAGGHELGNHTQRHLSDLAEQPERVAESEFAAVATTLTRLTGSPGAFARPSAMRHGTPAVLAAAGRAGYRRVLSYDVDPEDYRDPGADAIVRRTLAAVRPGSVISLHLGHAGTVAALPRLLAGLSDRGLTAVTATALLG